MCRQDPRSSVPTSSRFASPGWCRGSRGYALAPCSRWGAWFSGIADRAGCAASADRRALGWGRGLAAAPVSLDRPTTRCLTRESGRRGLAGSKDTWAYDVGWAFTGGMGASARVAVGRGSTIGSPTASAALAAARGATTRTHGGAASARPAQRCATRATTGPATARNVPGAGRSAGPRTGGMAARVRRAVRRGT